MQMNPRLLIPAAIMILALGGYSAPVLSQPAASPPPEKSVTSETTDSSIGKYGAMLHKERQALERQADRHIASVEKLYDRALYLIGVVSAIALGLFYWQFGKTRKELRDEIKDMMKGFARELVDQEAVELKSRLRSLKREVDDLNVYKSRKVVWATYQDGRRIEPIIRALNAFGITNIDCLEVDSPDVISLDNPDLVILSFDGTDKGRTFLCGVIKQIERSSPPIPLLIFTYNYGGPEIRLGTDDFKILKGFDWYLPANVPATLISHTTALLRRTS